MMTKAHERQKFVNFAAKVLTAKPHLNDYPRDERERRLIMKTIKSLPTVLLMLIGFSMLTASAQRRSPAESVKPPPPSVRLSVKYRTASGRAAVII